MWWTTPAAAGATLRKTWPRRSWCICTRTAAYHMCGCPHLTWAQRVRRIWGTYGNKFSNHWRLYFIPIEYFALESTIVRRVMNFFPAATRWCWQVHSMFLWSHVFYMHFSLRAKYAKWIKFITLSVFSLLLGLLEFRNSSCGHSAVRATCLFLCRPDQDASPGCVLTSRSPGEWSHGLCPL